MTEIYPEFKHLFEFRLLFVSAVVFNIELKRKAREGFYTPSSVTLTMGLPASMGELVSNAIVGLILGGKGLYAFQHYDTFRHDPASVILSAKMDWVGAFIGAAALLGITYWDGQRRKPPQATFAEYRLAPASADTTPTRTFFHPTPDRIR